MSESPQPRKHWVTRDWRTIAVTPCPPGWRNVYDMRDQEDCPEPWHAEPCPAILLQELHELRQHVAGDKLPKITRYEPPYPHRAVFADKTNGDGTLGPVDDCGNYWRTLGPGEELPNQEQP